MAQLNVQHVDKIYDNNVQAVFDFNLDVKDGELIVLVGPSGCGKSTTLRMIAGLEDISAGHLLLDGKDITQTPAKDRDMAMVFQNYALYGHMTIYENMAFSLTLRKENPNVIHKKGACRRGDPGAHQPAEQKAGTAVRRSAAARGHGPLHRPQSQGLPL